ncbi:MAG: [FeFe] hydrogenase, group A [Planctomycetia bacterium]|nr:[FeFe] hydrogenase, group A [Planctomycetia bacterium]
MSKSYEARRLSRRQLLKSGLLSLTFPIGASLFANSQTREEKGDGFRHQFKKKGERGNSGFGRSAPLNVSANNPSIQLNKNRCERCGDCRYYCRNLATVEGYYSEVDDSLCIHCGQCTLFCPGNALTERYDYSRVAEKLSDSDQIVIASIAPAVRISIGEMFGALPGTDMQGKLIQGLRQIGFDYVLDTSFSADLTVMEEATELISRLNQESVLPLMTSCCPAWTKFAELFYPEFLPNLSTAKSPFMMQGAIIKTWFAQQNQIDPAKIINIAIAPCTAKKEEILRPGMNAAGLYHEQPSIRDIDLAITTREIGQLFKSSNIKLMQLKNGTFDPLLGTASGAGMIFGNTGGVLEATVRTAYWLLNKEEPPESFLKWEEVRGLNPVRQATVDLKERQIKVAVVHGMNYARLFLELIKRDHLKYDFIEVMACYGGCMGGGGQPRTIAKSIDALLKKRMDALYRRDEKETIRYSFKNPEVISLYDQFLGEPCAELSQKLLHCH